MCLTFWLIALVGLMLGLLISAIASDSDRAVSFVIIALIPQLIFANSIFALNDTTQYISNIMPARWGVQALGSVIRLRDRFTGHDTPFYPSDWAHVAGFWAALVGLALLALRRNDVRSHAAR
jgi:ABC-type multidrug transport system permease subunit